MDENIKIKINKKKIGYHEPCFIIAEAGINHNGKLKLAKRLVQEAAKAGADAIKFQTFKASSVVIKNFGMASYAKKINGKKLSQLDLLKKFELDYEKFKQIKKYCDDYDIIFLSTPHSFDAIDFLENLVPAYKFGSGDITNIFSLQHAAGKGKPIIIGTGMSTIREIKTAIENIKAKNNNQIVALHCTTNYPCPIEEANLKAITTMQNELNCLVGYSDHTQGCLAAIIAVSIGACVVEKHFTLDRSLPGPDHKASIEPKEFKNFIEKIRTTEIMLGSEEKKPTKSEKKIMKYVRKSIVAKKFIPKGTVISHEMITIKRPGTGLKPSQIKNLIGKKTKRNISRDELLKLNMVE